MSFDGNLRAGSGLKWFFNRWFFRASLRFALFLTFPISVIKISISVFSLNGLVFSPVSFTSKTWLITLVHQTYEWQIILIRNGETAWKHEPPTQKSLWYLKIYQTVQNTEDQLLVGTFHAIMDKIEADILQIAKRWDQK